MTEAPITPGEHDPKDEAGTVETAPREELVGLSPELVQEVCAALEAGAVERVRELVLPLHYADAADLLERLSPDQRRGLVDAIRAEFNPDILIELDEAVRDEVIERLGYEDLAQKVTELDTDDAVYVIEQLDEDEQRQILDALPAEDRTFIEEGLAYPDGSAGRMMQRELVAVPTFWTVGETIDFMRDQDDLPEDFHDIFVVDPRYHPVGIIPVSRLLRSKRPVPVTELMLTEMKRIPVLMDREEVAFLFRQHNLISAPVVDPSGRLVGVITIDDVVDVIEEEAEEDLLRLGGVAEGDFYRAIWDTFRARSTWLLVNMGTALLASAVIGLFAGTIEQVVALAVLMPIVASMGGNAGTQTLTVTVRALATKELTTTNARRAFGKEVLVGLSNGLVFAVVAGGVSWLWFHDPVISAVMGSAMIINLLAAASVGLLVPLGLSKLGIDPAVASSVFVTTVTDVIGFFAFLGLAALVIF